jgi:hypothetical protein
MMTIWVPLVLAALAQSPPPTEITGTVRDEQGRPIAGASVFISTAAPRQGVGVL